jgi:glycogen(starch) synthase
MRILHILDHSPPRHGPYVLRTMAILRRQRALGWHTIALTGPRQGRLAATGNDDGWHFFRTAATSAWWDRAPLLQPFAAASAIVRRLHPVIKLTRPDLLHAHSPAANALAALCVGRRYGLPVLFELHPGWDEAEGGLRWQLGRALETHVARRADALAAASDGLRAGLAARGVPAAAISVIPDGVDLRHFSSGQARDPALARQLGLGQGPVIGFVGALQASEGLDLLLAALPSLLRDWPALRLLLVGAGPHEAALKERAEQLGLAASVIFCGRAGRERSAALGALIDLMVYPRLPLRLAELAPATGPLEAMAQGRPIAASDLACHRELIEHGKTGILFEAGSASALADAVRALLAEPSCWPVLGGAARAYALRERSWDASVARYAPLYAALLEARRAR